MTRRTVVFVCAHGAARSRLAAAWFNADPPAGWYATTAAAEDPAPTVNPRVEALLTGTPAAASQEGKAGLRPMVATIAAVDTRRPSHLTPDDHGHVLVQSPLTQIRNQSGNAPVQHGDHGPPE